MPDFRTVHDILHSKKLNGRALIAFIQHGTREAGFTYEVVCPYCTNTVGHVAEEVDDLGPVELSREELASEMKKLMAAHIPSCTDSWTRVKVQKATRPLGTERLIKEI